MRYLLSMCCVTLLLSLGMAATVEAQDGNGRGGVPTLASQPGGDHASPGNLGDEKPGNQHGNAQVSVLKRQGKVLNQQETEQEIFLKQQQKLVSAQKQLAAKLADAQDLREIAQRNGNRNLLAEANRMEEQARQHYARQVAKLEDAGTTDPALNPGGMTSANSNRGQAAPNTAPVPNLIWRIERLLRP